MNQIPNIEEEYTSHEALKEWEKEKDQYNLTQNIVTLLGIHGMHCKFYEYQNASHITKAFEDLFHQQLQKAREERDEQWRNAIKYLINNSEGSQDWYSALRACKSIVLDHSELDQDKK